MARTDTDNKEMKCFNFEVGTDTGGNPIYQRQCYCKTSACRYADVPVKDINTEDELDKILLNEDLIGNLEITHGEVVDGDYKKVKQEIEKMVLEAVDGPKGKVINYTEEQNNFAIGYNHAVMDIRKRLKEKLGK